MRAFQQAKRKQVLPPFSLSFPSPTRMLQLHTHDWTQFPQTDVTTLSSSHWQLHKSKPQLLFLWLSPHAAIRTCRSSCKCLSTRLSPRPLHTRKEQKPHSLFNRSILWATTLPTKNTSVSSFLKPWSHDRKTTTLWRGQSRGTCHGSDTEDKKRKSNSVIQNRGSIKLHNTEYMH